MNNKILARIVAVVMAVAMLGTVSFATGKNFPEPTISEEAEYMSYIAFFAPETVDKDAYEPTADQIVYLGQSASNFPTTTFGISANATRVAALKEAGNDTLYVRYGNTDAEVETFKLADIEAWVEFLGADAIKTELFNADDRYYNLVMAEAEIELGGNTLAEYGIKFGKFASAADYPAVDGIEVTEGTPIKGADGENDAEVVTVKSTDTTLVEGEGAVNFTAIILGVDEAKTAGLTAHAYAEYVQ